MKNFLLPFIENSLQGKSEKPEKTLPHSNPESQMPSPCQETPAAKILAFPVADEAIMKTSAAIMILEHDEAWGTNIWLPFFLARIKDLIGQGMSQAEAIKQADDDTWLEINRAGLRKTETIWVERLSHDTQRAEPAKN